MTDKSKCGCTEWYVHMDRGSGAAPAQRVVVLPRPERHSWWRRLFAWAIGRWVPRLRGPVSEVVVTDVARTGDVFIEGGGVREVLPCGATVRFVLRQDKNGMAHWAVEGDE